MEFQFQLQREIQDDVWQHTVVFPALYLFLKYVVLSCVLKVNSTNFTTYSLSGRQVCTLNIYSMHCGQYRQVSMFFLYYSAVLIYVIKVQCWIRGVVSFWNKKKIINLGLMVQKSELWLWLYCKAFRCDLFRAFCKHEVTLNESCPKFLPQ